MNTPMNVPVTWSPGMTLEAMERAIIQRAYHHYQKNKTATASSLGIAVRTLDAKLAKYEKDDVKEHDRAADADAARRAWLDKCRGRTPPV